MNGTMTVNKQGHLVIGGCDVVELAKQYGTPLYVLDEEEIIQKADQYLGALSGLADYEIIYAGKAFLTVGMCKLLTKLGLSLDVVSGGELYTALRADFPAEKIYFHGNNKSVSELRMALDAKIGRIVVDNLYELSLLSEMAQSYGIEAEILLRVTPGVEAHTHSYIQTGQLDSKFGIGLQDGQAFRAMEQAWQLPGIRVRGIHCHIGSQIFDVTSFGIAIDLMMDFMLELSQAGMAVDELDIGGGLGIRYTQDDSPVPIREFGKILTDKLLKAAKLRDIPVPKLLLEPGRSLVGEAGTTLYTVGTIKDVPGIRTYASVDGGMGDNPRVALYQAEYTGIVANKANGNQDFVYTIAGKCCESGDMLIFDAKLPQLQAGDVLAVLSTGAYNFSMASNYNMLPRPAVVTVYQGSSELVVERESYEDLIRLHKTPARWEQDADVKNNNTKVAG